MIKVDNTDKKKDTSKIEKKNVDKLKKHLTEKSNVGYFDVEIQRDGNLKMIRVRL